MDWYHDDVTVYTDSKDCKNIQSIVARRPETFTKGQNDHETKKVWPTT